MKLIEKHGMALKELKNCGGKGCGIVTAVRVVR